MNKAKVLTRCLLVAAASLALAAGMALAYDQYSDATNASGRCAACHGEFRGNQDYISAVDGTDWGSNLHGPHADWVLGQCDTCHNSQLGRTVILDQATGNGLLDPVSCAGCHSRDEDPGPGVSVWGAGLRQHHWRAGIETCGDAGCHAGDSDPGVFTPVGEDVQPPYYGDPNADLFSPDLPQDPCNDPANGIDPDEVKFGNSGLDNDGDDAYDTADTDCGAVVSAPGETSDPAALPFMLVTSYDGGAELMSLSYGNPCDASNNAILYGPLSDVGAYNYTGGSCSQGNSGTVTNWSYAGAPDSFFFLMVADNGSKEGSYGTCKPFVVCDPVAGERPSDDLLVPPACPLAQDLPNRCD